MRSVIWYLHGDAPNRIRIGCGVAFSRGAPANGLKRSGTIDRDGWSVCAALVERAGATSAQAAGGARGGKRRRWWVGGMLFS